MTILGEVKFNFFTADVAVEFLCATFLNIQLHENNYGSKRCM